jgi:hypothetical protein
MIQPEDDLDSESLGGSSSADADGPFYSQAKAPTLVLFYSKPPTLVLLLVLVCQAAPPARYHPSRDTRRSVRIQVATVSRRGRLTPIHLRAGPDAQQSPGYCTATQPDCLGMNAGDVRGSWSPGLTQVEGMPGWHWTYYCTSRLPLSGTVTLPTAGTWRLE